MTEKGWKIDPRFGRQAVRIWSRVKLMPTGCWLWTAAQQGRGYGTSRWNGRQTPAHRAVYEVARGPIPRGLTLDHLCRVRLCVNPDHLEPVTIGENLRRGIGFTGMNFRKTHCKRGHLLEGENVYREPGRPSMRNCVRCKRGRNREYMRTRGKS